MSPRAINSTNAPADELTSLNSISLIAFLTVALLALCLWPSTTRLSLKRVDCSSVRPASTTRWMSPRARHALILYGQLRGTRQHLSSLFDVFGGPDAIDLYVVVTRPTDPDEADDYTVWFMSLPNLVALEWVNPRVDPPPAALALLPGWPYDKGLDRLSIVFFSSKWLSALALLDRVANATGAPAYAQIVVARADIFFRESVDVVDLDACAAGTSGLPSTEHSMHTLHSMYMRNDAIVPDEPLPEAPLPFGAPLLDLFVPARRDFGNGITDQLVWGPPVTMRLYLSLLRTIEYSCTRLGFEFHPETLVRAGLVTQAAAIGAGVRVHEMKLDYCIVSTNSQAPNAC